MKFVVFTVLLVTVIALVRSAPADEVERPELLSELSEAVIHVLTPEEMSALGYSDVPLLRACYPSQCNTKCRSLGYKNGYCQYGGCICYR